MIQEVLDAVNAQLLAVLTDLGLPVPTFSLGERELADLDTTPRIAWIPRGGPIAVAKKNGGDFIRHPGALWHRSVQVNAHIWHDDVASAEVLAGHLVAALHYVACGSYAVTGETWDTRGSTAEGVLCILECQLRMPFTREMPTTVQPTSAPMTPHYEAQ
jgi:hypothetical protein